MQCKFGSFAKEVFILNKSEQPLDCLIVGAGPAGLIAAIYLARELGADCDEQGDLLVDQRRLQTSISGFYAAGDVVDGLNQISAAAGHAAIAATTIHHRLNRR